MSEPLSFSGSAEKVILINGKTGVILYEKNMHSPAFPASITKTATALYVLNRCGDQLDMKVKATQDALASISPQAKKQSNYRNPPHWLETDGGHIGIKIGEELTLRDLLYAMLVCSANDAANVIAHHVGGTIPKFMVELNLFLKEMGCKHTHFLNPHGLHHPDHITTAYDQAMIAREAMKDPLFRTMVSTVSYTAQKTNLEFERTFKQTNRLLRDGAYYYPYSIGIKTGTTSAAGKPLIAAAEKQGRELLAVVLETQGNKRYDDTIKLFETAFNQPKMRRTLLPKGVQKLKSRVVGGRGWLKTALPNGLSYDFYPAEELPVKATVQWEIPLLPIEKGTKVGVVKVVDSKGNAVQSAPLLAAERVKPTLFFQLKKSMKEKRKVVFGVVVSSFLLYMWSRRRKRRKRHSRPLF